MVSMSKASADPLPQGAPHPETGCPVGTWWCVDHDEDDAGIVRCEGPVFSFGDYWGSAVGTGAVDGSGAAALVVRLSVRSDSCRTPDGVRGLTVEQARDAVATMRLAEGAGFSLSTAEVDAVRVLSAALAHLDGAGG